MSLPQNFNISSYQSYEHLKQISDLQTETKSPIDVVAKWARSVAAAAVAPSSSPIRVVTKQIDQMVDAKIASLDKKRSDFIEDQILYLKVSLLDLETMRVNLNTHNKVIREYNNRFIAKDSSIAACPQHEEMLAKIDQAEKRIQANLERHCRNYSDAILDQLMTQIESGMPIDRDFLRDHYPDILKKFDILPDRMRVAAVENLHEILNKAYVANLHAKLMADFRSVVPQSMDAIMEKFNLGHLMEGENAEKSVRIMSEELMGQMNRDDVGTISFPDYVDLIHGKFLAHAAELMKAKAPNDKALNAAINLLHEIHELEQESVKVWLKASQQLSTAEIEAAILEAREEIFAEDQEAFKEVINQEGMKRIVAAVRERLAEKNSIDYLRAIHQLYDTKFLLSPDYCSILREVILDETHMKKSFSEVISTATRDYLSRSSQWDDDNLKYRNFEFYQGEKSKDYILGRGCCWAITLEWCKKLIALKTTPVTSYESFMPPQPLSTADMNDLNLKPTMKKFMEDLKSGMSESRVTPQMRRAQAQSLLEQAIGKTSQDKAAEKLGFKPVTNLFELRGTCDEFFKQLMNREEMRFKSGLPSPLQEVNGVVGFYGLSPDGPGHAMVLQMDFANNIFRLGDPNMGMWTFPDKETFLREVPKFVEANYPHFTTFGCQIYSPNLTSPKSV